MTPTIGGEDAVASLTIGASRVSEIAMHPRGIARAPSPTMQPITRETFIDRRQPQMRWSVVFAGAAFSVALWVLLQALGTGLGLATVDVDDTGSLKGIGLATGIWSIIAPLIAIFVGTLVGGRLAGTPERRVGAMHGAITWALSMIVGVWMVITVVSTMASGVARAGEAAASATSSAIGGAVKAGGAVDLSSAMSSLGIDTNDLLAPVNDRLQRAGKPAVTAAQLEATVRGIAQRGLHDGRLDRQVLVDELARNTALSTTDAQEISTQFGDRYEALATKVQNGAERVRQGVTDVAQQAVDKTGKAMLVFGLMMLLSLGAAFAGGALGAGKRRVMATGPDASTRVTVTG